MRKHGDRLAQAESLIDREAFKPITHPLYHNKTPRRGRPNIDEPVMVKRALARSLADRRV